MVLHSWTRDLTFYPHMHAIVSAGALSPEGAWVASRKGYLFPVKVMARLFRRLMLQPAEQGATPRPSAPAVEAVEESNSGDTLVGPRIGSTKKRPQPWEGVAMGRGARASGQRPAT